LGAGAAVSVLGYRLAMLVSGAMALILADHLSWQAIYQIMAALMLVGVTAALLGPEPEVAGAPHTLAAAVTEPFRAFFRREAALFVLLFIVLYKLPDAIAGAMTTPFLMDVGFSKTDIGAVNKGLGLVATIVGALAGGALIARLGLYRSLWAFGILQAVTNLTYLGVALLGQNYTALILAVGTDNLSGGMGSAAFVAFLMSLTERRYSATQYALLSSLMAITPKIIGAPAGVMAADIGWPLFFSVSVLGALPGLALLWWLMRRGAIGHKTETAPVPTD
jgi:PAT family beta-lactamase induction signal transducer AmpG